MQIDDHSETVRYKLDVTDERRQQMSDEINEAPTYALKIVPGEHGPTITTIKNRVVQNVSTATTLKCRTLHQKLAGSDISPGAAPDSRYERLEILGEGGTGQVYEMLDHNVNRRVAVKILKDPGSLEDVDAFIQEGILGAELEHPNIIPIYDMDVDEAGRIFLSMKKVGGQDLMTLARSDEVSVAELIAVILKVCDALSYAHSLNKVHQDVKPENIMVGEFGEVFLIDWGAGSQLSEDMQVSPVYMSPQQAVGDASTAADDIYCLGASLFHVLTKRFPTTAETIDELWERKVAGDIDLPTKDEEASIPTALLAIALKAMEPEVAYRYQTVEEFARDIKAYQNGFATSAEDAGALTLFKLLMKRRWKEVLLAHAVLLVIVGVGTKYYLDIHRTSLAKLEAELTAANLELEKQEQWIPFFTADFTKPGNVGPGIVGGESLKGAPEGIGLGFRSQYGELKTSKPFHSDPKIEITFVSNGIPRLEVFVCNELNESLRCLIIGEQVGFSTIGATWTHVYSGNKPVRSIIRPGETNSVVFWLRNGTWYVELNGVNVMTYYDPDLNFLEDGAIFRLKRLIHIDELRIQSIRTWRRQAPVVVSILEPGKALYREGRSAAARRWFLKQAESAANSTILQEATYLAAIANDGAGVENQIRELQDIAERKGSSFRAQALHKIAVISSETQDMDRTLDYLEQVSHEAPALNTYGVIWPTLHRKLMLASPETRGRVIKKLSMLPLTGLNLSKCGLATLPPINKTVRKLELRDNPIQDLSAVRGLSLNSLELSSTGITDLTPIRGMDLKTLYLNGMAVDDLSALAGMRLELLVCKEATGTIDLGSLENTTILKPIFDGSTLKNLDSLKGTKAVHLRIRNCGLTNLDFAEGMNLNILDATQNKINDISGLKGQTLSSVLLSNNEISDLTPFESFEVTSGVSLSHNPIEDISPLAGQPLKLLDISHTNVRDLSVLRTLKNMRYFHFDGDGQPPPPDLTYLEGGTFARLSLKGQNLTSIAPLLKCQLTGSLDLSNNPLSDLSPLSGQQLQNLTLIDTNVTDLSPLSGLKDLGVVSIGSSKPETPSALSDIGPICTDTLQVLKVANCSIRDMSTLQQCKLLRYLDLSGNPLTTLDPLEGLGVKFLDLSNTQVNDFSILTSLKQLRVLSINGLSLDKPGEVRDLSDFSALVLSSLSLKNNNIADISPLRSTMVSVGLDLSGNPISDLSALETHSTRHLDISHTAITDLTPIRTMPHLEKLVIRGLTLDSASEQRLKEMPWLTVIRD